jgi:hypothetical protein
VSVQLVGERDASSLGDHIGLVAGVIAIFVYPGNKYEPKGFATTSRRAALGAD